MIEPAEWIREELKKHGLKISELSKLSGIPQNTISKYTLGMIKPGWENTIKMLDAFGIKFPDGLKITLDKTKQTTEDIFKTIGNLDVPDSVKAEILLSVARALEKNDKMEQGST